MNTCTLPMTAEENFIRDLLVAVPELERTYLAHCSEHEEISPHVFMGDVASVILAIASSHQETVVRFFRAVEGALKGGGIEEELLAVSFVENLIGEDQKQLRELKSLMGARLREELAAIE